MENYKSILDECIGVDEIRFHALFASLGDMLSFLHDKRRIRHADFDYYHLTVRKFNYLLFCSSLTRLAASEEVL
jgi:hypothetical protein